MNSTRETGQLCGADTLVDEQHGDIVFNAIDLFAIPAYQGRSQLVIDLHAPQAGNAPGKDRTVERVKFVASQRAKRCLGERAAQYIEQVFVHREGRPERLALRMACRSRVAICVQ